MTCQTMHRVAIAPITDHTPTKNARNVHCDITGRPARCWMWCAGSHDLKSPLRTRASHLLRRTGCISTENITAHARTGRQCSWRAGTLRIFAPPGCASVSLACRDAPYYRSAGFQPAYGDTLHHPCTVWVRERRARMPGGAGVAPASSPLGARASRPHAGSAGVSPASSPLGARVSRPHAGYASVAPACRGAQALRLLLLPWVRERRARMPGGAGSYCCWMRMLVKSRSHAGCAGVALAHSGATHQRAGRPHPEARVFPQV